MESLESLQSRLTMVKSELAAMTKTRIKDTPFMPGELDGHSEAYEVTEYTDYKTAMGLKREQEELERRIKNYAHDAEAARRSRERYERESEERREGKIVSVSKELYDRKMAEYMEKNLWGKARTMFAGKRPKKMTEPEIVSAYGKEAVDTITSPAIERLMQEKEAQLESVKKTYADDPKMLEYAIRQTNLYYDSQIELIRKTYAETLTDVQRKKK